MGKQITMFVDILIDRVDEWTGKVGKSGAHKNDTNEWSFRLFVFLMALAASAHPIVCYCTVAVDPHVVFWMGSSVRYALLLVPIVLVGMAVSISVIQCAKPSPRTTKYGFISIVLATSGALLCSGLYLAHTTYSATLELTEHCGSTPLTNALQSQWSRLVSFHKACQERTETKNIFIQQCPGFSVFTSNVLAQYIEDLEFDFDCQGFCHFWDDPLFNEDVTSGRRCASVLGEVLEKRGYICSVPMLATAAVIFLIGACVASYDHL